MTRLHAVAWQERHGAQQRLYEAVTDYVRHGYNKALAAKQRHIGFLMILMQRLVTSSTAAIRTTLERRLAMLDEPQLQNSLFESSDTEEWSELDGQSQVDIAIQMEGWAQEKSEVELLLNLARETEVQGTDAKAEALLELVYKLQQEENDPALKLLIFTEFVPTQAMLTSFLESRGFSVAHLNGGMDLDARTKAQQAFSQDVRVLISTDAGGEGLNLQFCHVIVNFDMPWNPMRLEQRIGRVDRIGQQHVVRAINFVLEDTVEHRVRQVLEEKLAVIAQEFGVDKASDVMDSVEAEPIFDELFVHGLQDPTSIERECDAAINQVRDKVAESRKNSELLSDAHSLEADDARKWRDHPAQFWLERAITAGLPARGGSAVKAGDAWRVRWMDGSESSRACFDARTAEQNPNLDWITLEDPRARAVISELPRWAAGQPMPVAKISGLPDNLQGVWSLWEISLSAVGFSRKRFLPVFSTDEGRTYLPTAKRIWDLLLTESVEVLGATPIEHSEGWFEVSMAAAKTQGERVFSSLVEEQRIQLREERDRAQYAYEARYQAIGRIGLPQVREHRRKRLNAEHDARMAALDDAEASVPESLRSTLWHRIDDLADYRMGLQRILSAIFDVDDKPAIGQPPARFSGPAPLISGLTRVDDLALRAIARVQIDDDAGLVEWDRLRSEPALQDLPQQELLDSLEILEQHYYIKIGRVLGAPLSHVVLTDYGFQQYAEAYVEGYEDLVARIAALLVNENVHINEELATRVDRPRALVDFVLNLLEANNHIKVSRYMGGQSNVWDISASLRRAVQQH